MSLPILLAIWLLAPLLDAGFFTDDWVWLAIARHLDNPWPAFSQQVMHDYFYRPLPLLSWWLAERAFGNDADGHYLINISLHLVSTWLLWRILRRFEVDHLVALIAALIFIALPSSTATVAWLSNRNELMAVMFGLAALWLSLRSPTGPGTEIAIALSLWLALICKETAVLFVAAIGLHWLAAARKSGLVDYARLCALILPLLALVVVRQLVLTRTGFLDQQPLLQKLVIGLQAWATLWPRGVFGLQTNAPLAIAAATISVLAMLFAISQYRRSDRPLLTLAPALLLLIGPAFLLWPVTAQVLRAEDADQHLVNARFYYISGLGLALLLALVLKQAGQTRWRTGATVAALVLLLGATWQSRTAVEQWSETTGVSSKQQIAIAESLLAETYASPCVLQLMPRAWPETFPDHADAVIKASAARGSSIANCLVYAERRPYIQISTQSLCRTDTWPGVSIRQYDGHDQLTNYGNLCVVISDFPTAASGNHYRR